MSLYQTDFDKCDWPGIDEDVANAMNKLKVAWQDSQKTRSTQSHEQFVVNACVPALQNLAQFCIDVDGIISADDGEYNDAAG